MANPCRKYVVDKIMGGFYFCPICHRRIDPPDFLANSNVKASNGLTLACGNCKKGTVQIQVKEKETSDVIPS